MIDPSTHLVVVFTAGVSLASAIGVMTVGEIAAVIQSVVALVTAIGVVYGIYVSKGNRTALVEVDKKVNGITKERVDEAHKTSFAAGELAASKAAELKTLQRDAAFAEGAASDTAKKVKVINPPDDPANTKAIK